MICMNELMEKTIKLDIKRKKQNYTDIVNEICNDTYIFNGLLIYKKNKELNEMISKEDLIKFYGDWTGYEASYNEIRIKKNKVSASSFIEIAIKLKDLLSNKYNNQNIVVYLSLYDDDLEIRFHTRREDEPLWLDDDLNKYDIPILCCK